MIHFGFSPLRKSRLKIDHDSEGVALGRRRFIYMYIDI